MGMAGDDELGAAYAVRTSDVKAMSPQAAAGELS